MNTKPLLPILFLCSTALAQFNQSYPVNPHEPNEVVPSELHSPTESESKAVKIETPKTAVENRGNLSGLCRVQKGNGNFGQTPCTELILQLVPKTGEVISTRTERDGTFYFSVNPTESYTLETSSKFFEVVTPTKPVRAGKDLKVWLKQK
jgi:hypothetical protein